MLANPQAYGFCPVVAGDHILIFGAVFDPCYIAQQNRGTVDMAHHHPFQGLDGLKLSIGGHRILDSFALYLARGQFDMFPFEGLKNIDGRKLARAKRLTIEPDPDIAFKAAEYCDPRDTLNGFEARIDLAFDRLHGSHRTLAGLERNPKHRLVVGIEGIHHGGLNCGRELVASLGDFIPHLLRRDIQIGPEFKLNLDHRRTAKARRRDFANARDGVEALFKDIGHVFFHAFGRGVIEQ